MNVDISTNKGHASGAPSPEKFKRSISLVDNFALGFTYLSPGAGVLSIFAFGLAAAGPPSIWWFFIIAAGQLLVALVFGEVVSQYPITGGIYPWARRLWNRKYAWFAAWVYIWSLAVTTTAVTQFAVPFLGQLLRLNYQSDLGHLLIAQGLCVVALVLNMTGTKTLAMVAKIGFICELVGVLALGLYLLIFERVHSFAVLFDTMGVAKGGSYVGAFLLAALVGLWQFYGFEACGDVAEEVEDPERKIPTAMIITIVVGLIGAVVSYAGFILAAPNLQDIVNGNVADPIPAIVRDSTGWLGMELLLAVAFAIFLSAVLSQQAALSRLIFSFARDNMIPQSRWLAKLNEDVAGAGAVPRNAMIVACGVPLIINFWLYFKPDAVVAVTSFAVLGIYVCFQMVVLAALRQRMNGWIPGGRWSLGRAGGFINVAALIYGIAAIIILAWPGAPDLAFLDRWIVLIGLAVVAGTGLLYMIVARPYGKSDAPENDAIEVSARLRQRQWSAS